jgi:hypothetical protein
MGLDVYLYRYDRSPAEQAHEKACEDLFARKIEQPSKVYSDHTFHVGYFRSSYNGSGFNRIVADRIGVTLDDIFPSPTNEYVRTVDWGEALKRARDARDKLAAYIAESGNFLVIDVEVENIFGAKPSVKSEKDALALYVKERKNHLARAPGLASAGYSNRDGHFFHSEPLRVVGLVPGRRKILRDVPAVYAIVETTGDEPGLKWYQQALEIVVETCEYVLGQEDPSRFLLHWSG